MNKSRSSQKKKQKSQDPKRLRNIRIPVEHEIPQCEVCEEKKADFYCTECKVHYCQNCESEVHTSFWKKKHKEFIFQEPYVPRKKINSNLCSKHMKELCLYCIDENELICGKCYSNCKINNHSILALDEYSNEISEKIKIILNKIQNEEIQSQETIQKSLELKNKFKIEIKELSNLIETQSDLLIQKIQKLKINHLNLLKKVGIISDLKFDQIINKNEAKKEEINETKNQIKILKKLEKDEKTIKLIRESKEIIEKDKEEGGGGRVKVRKRESQRNNEKDKEEFDPKMNYINQIKLKNINKTAWNPSTVRDGVICGKKIYSQGKHQIKIKIDQFPNRKNKSNVISLGVIKTENRENLIKKKDCEKTYYFTTFWSGNEKKIYSQNCKRENGKSTQERYTEEIKLKKNDIFEIILDMDQKKISFKINEKNLVGWGNLPEKVNFFISLRCQKGKEKNQITII
ncbi:tripartite motif-containing protein [Anaeramoeba flamelloides]|uniref:Tripartite motif-containing protein n=1 Tax=Anaeramoeba flamelloides TaxID=1746091 RepID=A0ABQ8YIG1_9EUKA|nr:tripartite motif-containing protein [Anaeramoeba flamelloides]